MDIVAFYPGLNLSKRAKMSKTYPYLLRNLAIARPNQVWSIRYLIYWNTNRIRLYHSSTSWYSRFLIGYTISNTLQSDNITCVVKEAMKTYGAPEIINSDQGSQFTSAEYIELIKSLETTRIRMDGKDRATDNIAIERFFR